MPKTPGNSTKKSTNASSIKGAVPKPAVVAKNPHNAGIQKPKPVVAKKVAKAVANPKRRKFTAHKLPTFVNHNPVLVKQVVALCALRKMSGKPKVFAGGTKSIGWNKVLNKPPEKNATYIVDGYTYQTDGEGRVAHVSGTLTLKERGRNRTQQGSSVLLKDGTKTRDHGGHLIANEFWGPGEQLNYVPQEGKLNSSGEWKLMENHWRSEKLKGNSVDVMIGVNYAPGSTNKRPVSFAVTYTITDNNTKPPTRTTQYALMDNP